MWPFGSGVSFNPAKDIPSLKGKVILVTGSNIGLGKSSVIEFARHGPERIFLAARSLEKANAAIEDVKKAVPDAPPMEPLEMDLGSLASVKRAAEVFNRKSQRLDILMLNAGIMWAAAGSRTSDGYENHFGTNHMGHALFTKLVLPALLRTAAEPGADVRVIVLSSMGLAWAPSEGVDFAGAKETGGGASSSTLYGQSKLANALYAQELARRYPSLRTAGVHPGMVLTNLGHTISDQYPFLNILQPLAKLLMKGPEQGALNQLWASVSPDVVSGELYTPVGIVGNFRGTDKVRDPDLARRLWEWTEEELKAY